MKANIGLENAVVRASYNVLTNLAADHAVLLFKSQNFHWNVKGSSFKAYHVFLEEIYNGIFVDIDDIAERVRALDMRPVGSMRGALEHNRIKEYPEDKELPCAHDMLSILCDDFETLIRELRKDLATLEEENSNDHGTVNFLEDMIERKEKTAWMIRSYMEKDECGK